MENQKQLSIEELQYGAEMFKSIKNEGLYYEYPADKCIEFEGEQFVRLSEVSDLLERAGIRCYQNYALSKSGKVLNVHTMRLRKPRINRSAACVYYRVQLCHKGSHMNVRLHRLIAAVFIKNVLPSQYTVIDHCDLNSLNNNIHNIRWVSQKVNNQDGHKLRKLYEDARQGICRAVTISYIEKDHLRQIEAYMRGGNNE